VCGFEVLGTAVALGETLPLEWHGGLVFDHRVVLDALAGLGGGVAGLRGFGCRVGG